MNTKWPVAPLGDLCDVQIGKTPPRARKEYWGAGSPWLSIADMNQGWDLVSTKETITQLAIGDCNCRKVEPGTALLSFKLSVGKVGIARIPMYTNEAIAHLPVRDGKQLDARFLCRALVALDLNESTDRAAMGATLNKAKLNQIQIPLPPIEEQLRIADALDQADSLRAKRRVALADLDNLTKSVFLEIFGDPVTNPKHWPLVPIGKIGTVVTGNTPSRAVPEYFGNDIEWIKSDNINTPEYFATRATEGLSASGRAVARVAPSSSILVTCIAGSPDCIGNSAMTDRPVAFNQQINALIPKQGDVDFIYAQLIVGKRLIQQASTSSMKGMVSKSRLENVQIIFPPVDLQRDFATRVSAIQKLKENLSKSLAYVDSLFASLQYRAFRGEL